MSNEFRDGLFTFLTCSGSFPIACGGSLKMRIEKDGSSSPTEVKVHNQCHDRLFLETEPFYHRRLSNKKAIPLSLLLIGPVV